MPFYRWSHRVGSMGAMALSSMLLLSACSSVPLDSELPAVADMVAQSGPRELVWVNSPEQTQWVSTQTSQLLAKPLTADTAVDIALLNNPGLQARFAELGIGKAEFEQASRLPNPGFRFGRFERGDEREVERSVHLNIVKLLLLPSLKKAEAQRLAQNRFLTAGDVLSLMTRTKRACYEAVAASQSLEYAGQVLKAAQASHELAKKMEQVGNFSALQ